MKVGHLALQRAKGCMIGQLAGDALGSQVEFQNSDSIRNDYPDGVREIKGSCIWNTIAGQPTDDSEMALLLARMLVNKGTYDPDMAFIEYQYWLNSDPFDIGNTIYRGIRGKPDHGSQSNGAMMRISPLGIFGTNYSLEKVAEWAIQDAMLTHPNEVCLKANALFCMAIAYSIGSAITPGQLYRLIRGWAVDIDSPEELLGAVNEAEKAPPDDYFSQQGWVLIAFHNALWQLCYADSFESALVDTVMKGGDTDTNGAICGALLGATYGLGGIPGRWTECILSCRPEKGSDGIHQPRPECFWPMDALDLAAKLITPGPSTIQDKAL